MALLSAERFWERMRSGRPVLSDGAMGSELIGRGIGARHILRANVHNEPIVRSIHEAYISAGAHFITSNTFGLATERDWAAKCLAGAAIALNAATKCPREVGVWLSFPACTAVMVEDWLRTLLETGQARPPAVLFETATSLGEARSAATVGRRLNPGVLAVTAHFRGNDRLHDGTTPEELVRALTSEGVRVVGANCGQTPEAFVGITARMRNATSAPLLIQPSAGLPTDDGAGNWHYSVGPARFAQVAARLAGAGADIIGGCCGTTPGHIGAVARTLCVTDSD